MHKLHVLLVAALFAGAAVLGTKAVLRTISHRPTNNAAVAARAAQLNRFQAQLHAQLAKRPPALPALPKAAPRTQAAVPRVIYRRPPAIVVVRHTHHGDDGGGESEGGSDD